jgi:hypothetical protein
MKKRKSKANIFICIGFFILTCLCLALTANVMLLRGRVSVIEGALVGYLQMQMQNE